MDEDGPPPPELHLAWLCERFGALPDAGGVLDQDAQTLRRAVIAGNVHRTLARMRGMEGAQIHNLSDSERKIIRALLDEGLI